MNVSLAAGFRPVHSPFLERRFLLRQGAGASGADRDAPVNEAGHCSPLPDTASTAHERPSPCNEFIVTVDVWHLHQFRWPIMGTLAPGYVEQLELSRYLRQLLATGRWRAVQAVPHFDAGRSCRHRFDVYGEPTSRRVG